MKHSFVSLDLSVRQKVPFLTLNFGHQLLEAALVTVEIYGVLLTTAAKATYFGRRSLKKQETLRKNGELSFSH